MDNYRKNRKIYLSRVFAEAAKIISEANAMDMPGGQSSVPPAGPPATPGTNVADPLQANPGAAEAPKQFDVDTLIERLNVIRGGKSFSDPEVYGQLTSKYKEMSDADKGVIDTFLQEIGKIVIQVDAQATSPAQGQPPVAQPTPSAPVAPPPTPPITPAPGV